MEPRAVSEAVARPRGRQAAIGFILATITLDMLSMSMLIPVLPQLVLAFRHGNASLASHTVGLFSTSWALMQFLASPVQGALSDRFGRRPVILLSNLGMGLDAVLMAMAPGVGLLFVGRVISGITAGSISAASAYIADITPPDQRARRFGLISVAFGFGFVAGPALGGALGAIGLRLPFWAAAALCLTNFLYGLLVLPESLPPERRSPWRWAAANPVGSLRLLRSFPGLFRLGCVNFLYLLAHNILPVLAVLYSLVRYHLGATQVGLLMTAFGVGGAVVGGALTGPLVRRLGERRALVLGLCCECTGLLAMALAPTALWFVAAVPVLSLGGLIGPSLGALMSRRVGPDAQGRLAGANSSLLGVAGLIGPTVYTASFAAGVAGVGTWHLPGVPFFLSAGFVAAALGTFLLGK
jgi:MFS transporter, DHA1 family, tetracycline resistance protein